MGSRGKPDLNVRPKVNPIQGELPVLQYCPTETLQVDEAYQRSLELAASVTLVRRIATYWDWGLCQPLYVARRSDGAMFVVDGQHRLAAAKLRGDIFQLPCVVRAFATLQDEAAAFVALNQERRPLNKLQIFHAVLAAGDFEASQIMVCLEDAGLRLASSTNLETTAPGAVSNIGGLQRCYRGHGVDVLTIALRALAQAYPEEVLRYAGTIFPGVVALTLDRCSAEEAAELVTATPQPKWYQRVLNAIADDSSLGRWSGAQKVFREAWSCRSTGACKPSFAERPARTFEEQLERVSRGEVGIGPNYHPTKASPDQTLGGVGTSLL